jgi:hypothetical protein
MAKRNRIWIVEMLDRSGRVDRWKPCNEAQQTQRECIMAARQWRENNDGDKFRVAEYLSVKVQP